MNTVTKAIAASWSLRRYNSLVHEESPTVAAKPQYQPGLPLRLLIISLAFLLEKVFLNGFVDFERADLAQGLGAIVRESQHWGFRFLVAFGAAIALFAYVRDGQKLNLIKSATKSSPIRYGWIVAHVFLIAFLAHLTSMLFNTNDGLAPFPALVTLWISIYLAAAITAFLAMAPWPLWINAGRNLGIIWFYAGMTAFLGSSAMELSQRLWEPTAGVTFELVRLVLLPILPSLHADAGTRVLSTDSFSVEVSPICSGLEGMGLILAFTIAWLVYFRREYIFPRALVLLPVGLAMIFSLNILRIAALILIGNGGFPEVAVYGFHSQAGWIAFNAVACAIVFFSRRSSRLNRTAAHAIDFDEPSNPTAAFLMPLLGILAAGVISRAMSADFDYFYGLRLLAGVVFLFVYRQRLMLIDWRFSWRAPMVGILAFAIWIFAAQRLTPATGIPLGLVELPPGLRGSWIASRLLTSVLLIPVAEELAYRGYLMRRLTNPDFESVSYQSVRLGAITLTAIAFGAAHGAMWLPGIATGMAFGILAVRRGSLGEAVVAHATTNALVAIAVLVGNQWQLW